MFILVYPIKVQPRLELEWIFITIPLLGNKRAYSIVEYLLGHKTHNKDKTCGGGENSTTLRMIKRIHYINNMILI